MTAEDDARRIARDLIARDLARLDVCGVVQIINGKEWICVKPVHSDPPRPTHGFRSDQWQNGYPPKSERHYFRRRYPYSDH